MLLHIDGTYCVVVVGEQVDGGILVVLQVEFRVVWFQGATVCKVRLFRLLSHNHSHIVLGIIEWQRLFALFQNDFITSICIAEVNRSGSS